MSFHRKTYSWSRGTTYYFIDTKVFQMGFYKMPWRTLPKFFFTKKL